MSNTNLVYRLNMDPTTLYYGVDVSKETLHICHQTGTDAKGQPQWAYQTLANQVEPIQQWSAQLPPNCHLIFEYTGTYSARLGWVLALQNRSFSLITPNQSKGFATTLKSISKTDRSDAALLARYGQVFQPQPSQLAEASLHQLRQQHKHLNDLRISQQAVANQLHALDFDPRASQKVKASLLVLQQSYLTQIALFDRAAGAG